MARGGAGRALSHSTQGLQEHANRVTMQKESVGMRATRLPLLSETASRVKWWTASTQPTGMASTTLSRRARLMNRETLISRGGGCGQVKSGWNE